MLHYLRTMAFGALTLAVVTVLLTIAVDPYRVWNTPSVPGWTAQKPRAYQRSVLAKTSLIEIQNPKTILLGNSRVEVGFDPESREWPVTAKPVFNAGLSGRGLISAAAVLRYSILKGAPQTVIVGLDFPDFLTRKSTSPGGVQPAEVEERLPFRADGTRNPDYFFQSLEDRIGTTLTIDALLDSGLTLLDQRRSSVTMTPLGFNPHHEYEAFAQRSGYYDLFAQKQRDYKRAFSQFEFPDFHDPYQNVEFGHLVQIIRAAGEHKMRLVLFISPYHCRYLELIRSTGFWPAFEAWKRAAVRLIEQEAQRSNASIQLVDFSDYNAVTTERVPQRGDTQTRLQWYWEPGHYKNALGELLIRTLMGRSSEFGRYVTTSNIESDLTDIRENRSKMACDNELSASR